MIRKIVPRLSEWSKSDLAGVVVIKGEGRAFCAGGDVASLALQNKAGPEGQQKSKDYFALEYKLDHLIATYTKPYVALIDGITMGGGVGLSLHAPFRIATENTVFAMPETNIGFFPDVGASFFLPRLDGDIGTYFALTSEQLKGVQVFYAGVATHYLHSSSLPDLEARLAELTFKDYDDLQTRLRTINSTIEEFATGLPHDQPIAAPIGGIVRSYIDYVFQSAHAIEDIFNALDEVERDVQTPIPKLNEQGEPLKDKATGEVVMEMPLGTEDTQMLVQWAQKTRQTLQKRSPTSIKVTLRALNEGRSWSIAQAFTSENRIAARFMEHRDFVEGVSALLIDKPKRTPTWEPSSFDSVRTEDVEEFFAEQPEFSLLGTEHGSSGKDFTQYPHAWIGLPTEQVIKSYVTGDRSTEDIIAQVVKEYSGKQGVKEKVLETLKRRTRTDGAFPQWADA